MKSLSVCVSVSGLFHLEKKYRSIFLADWRAFFFLVSNKNTKGSQRNTAQISVSWRWGTAGALSKLKKCHNVSAWKAVVTQLITKGENISNASKNHCISKVWRFLQQDPVRRCQLFLLFYIFSFSRCTKRMVGVGTARKGLVLFMAINALITFQKSRGLSF